VSERHPLGVLNGRRPSSGRIRSALRLAAQSMARRRCNSGQSLVSDMDTKPEHNRSEQARLRAKDTRNRTGLGRRTMIRAKLRFISRKGAMPFSPGFDLTEALDLVTLSAILGGEAPSQPPGWNKIFDSPEIGPFTEKWQLWQNASGSYAIVL